MKEVGLIILGALISCGTTILIDWLKFKREISHSNKRKKEETYIKMFDFMTEFFSKSKSIRITNIIPNELLIKLNSLKTNGYLYLNQEFVDKYYQLIIDMTNKEIENKDMDELYTYARNDLKIKNKWK